MGADEGGVVELVERARDLDEGLFGFGRLEDEQHQGPYSSVVEPGVAASEVASVWTQALGDPLGGGGAALVLQQAPVPIPLMTQLERRVGMQDEVLEALSGS